MKKILIMLIVVLLSVGCSMMMDESTDISYLSYKITSERPDYDYDILHGNNQRVYMFYDNGVLVEQVVIYTTDGINWYIQ